MATQTGSPPVPEQAGSLTPGDRVELLRYMLLMRATEERLKRLENYRSYLACGSNHCALPTQEFYSLRVNGTSLGDWVADLARGKDVRCPTCG